MTVTVRPASLLDLSATLVYARLAHERSNLAEFPYNAVIARQTLKTALREPNMGLWIALQEQTVCGLLIGVCDPMPSSAGLYATDVIFVADRGGGRLLDCFLDWARRKRVVRLDLSVSQADPGGRIDALYTGRGLQRAGGSYYLNCKESTP